MSCLRATPENEGLGAPLHPDSTLKPILTALLRDTLGWTLEPLLTNLLESRKPALLPGRDSGMSVQNYLISCS